MSATGHTASKYLPNRAGSAAKIRDERDAYRAALQKIVAYQGWYATDKNPSIRAIKRIASEALSDEEVTK